MIYVQNGPSWKPKVEGIIKKQLAKGIIWDPREEKIDRVNKIKSENEDFDLLDNIVDCKWFYKQFSNSELKNLKSLSYMPEEIINRNYLRDSKNIEDAVKKCFEYQHLYKVNKLLLPTVYINDFDDRIVDKVFDMCDFALNIIEEKNIYISIVVQENAFNNMANVNEFIRDLETYINKIKGIYIIIDRNLGGNCRHDFDSTRLSNIMNFNYFLNNINFDIIYGYTGLESLLLIASGANIVGSGWFYSLRRFNRQEKGLESYSGQGRHIKRYTSIKLLYELKIEENIIHIPSDKKEEIFDIILNDDENDNKFRKISNIEDININETYYQYFEALNNLLNPMKEKEIEDKIEYANFVIKNAITNIKKYNELMPLAKINDTHVNNYKEAIIRFKTNNYMD